MTVVEIRVDVAVIGGGVGGVAAARAAAESGARVLLSEQYPWLGGQLTSQAVPPDEHRWIEERGATASYQLFRRRVRDHYRSFYPLTRQARVDPTLNPGGGSVSGLCHEPSAAVAVIDTMLAQHRSTGQLTTFLPYKPIAATACGDRVTSVVLQHVVTGDEVVVLADVFVDATECGDLLPLTQCEYVTGSEAQADTDEPDASPVARPDNMQAITWCFAVDAVDGDHTIDRPVDYNYWRSLAPSFWGGPLLSWVHPHYITGDPVTRSLLPNPSREPADLVRAAEEAGNYWRYRRVLAVENFEAGAIPSDITIVNWPQNDFFEAPVIDVDDAEEQLQRSRQISLALLYWMQTEAPRLDGGTGFPNLRLRPDVTGNGPDGLAQAPYIRESRRIRAEYTIVQQDLAKELRPSNVAQHYPDSVGIGFYRLDLHPTTGGDPYFDTDALPFEIPLGALVPQRLLNLIPAAKNIGTTHITNGSYRLHPVEWNIGEVAGLLAAYCVELGRPATDVRNTPDLLADFQSRCVRSGIELSWGG